MFALSLLSPRQVLMSHRVLWRLLVHVRALLAVGALGLCCWVSWAESLIHSPALQRWGSRKAALAQFWPPKS